MRGFSSWMDRIYEKAERQEELLDECYRWLTAYARGRQLSDENFGKVMKLLHKMEREKEISI